MARPKGRARKNEKKRVQKGGLIPSAAVILALISGGKSLALSRAAYGAKKALGKIIKSRRDDETHCKKSGFFKINSTQKESP